MRTASRKKEKKSTAHKINITSLTPLSAGVWPTLHHLHTLCSFCPFLHPHKLLSPKHPVTKGDVQARWQHNRLEQSSCHGKKTSPSPPGLQEGQHSPSSSSFLGAHADGAEPFLLLPKKGIARIRAARESPREKRGLPRSWSISVTLCSSLHYFP